MIYCVRFSDLERFPLSEGFQYFGETEAGFAHERGDHERGDDFVTVCKPNHNGDLTKLEIDRVCDVADLHPPSFDEHWCD